MKPLEEVDPTEVHLPRVPLAASMVTFLVIGALAAALGPLLPLLQIRFGISLAVASTAVSAFYVGAVLGGFGSLLGFEIAHGGTLMAGALTALGAGAIGFAAAHSWPLLLASTVCLGLGFGALDSGLNQLMVRTEIRRRATRLNILNAAYPLGAVLGPLIITALGVRRLASGYLLIGILSLILAVAIRGVIATPTLRSNPTSKHSPTSPSSTFPVKGFVGLLAMAYVFYVGLEVNINAWMASELLSTGHSAQFAGGINAGFWAAVAFSRLGIGIFMSRLNPGRVVITACVAATLILPLLLRNSLAPVAFIAVGLVIGPIFPSGLLWLSHLRPRRPRDLSILLAGSMIGGALFPAATSAIVAAHGLRVVPPLLIALSIITLAFFGAAAWLGAPQRMSRARIVDLPQS